MTDQIEQSWDNSARFCGGLRWYSRSESRHGLDYLRRGMTASPTSVLIAGTGQAVFVAIPVRDDIYRTPPVPEAAIFVRLASALKSSFCRLSTVADSAAISTSTASIQKCARTSGEITRAGIDIAPFSGRVVEMGTRRIAAA